jgi:methanethiol S-methyltransferase
MLYFSFAILSYIIGLSSMAAFFWYIQFDIDQNLGSFSWISIATNLGLCFLFSLQHSVLPRARVKDWIHRHFPPSMERSLYVGTSGVAMWILLIGWRRMGPILFESRITWPFESVFYISLVLIILCTVALDHSSMFGLKQGYLAWKGKELPTDRLQIAGLYGVVRHPLTSLLIVCLWSHATMTAGRLLFNVLFTIYAIAGTVFEEKSLLRKFGPEYEAYRAQVPAFVPLLK